MRLYFMVALLTFVGSFAVYSGSHMLGAASAVGDGQMGSIAFLKNFNPFYLLQGDRLRSAVGAGSSGLPRMEPFQPKFGASTAWTAVRPPRIDPEIGRHVYIAPPRPVTIPQINVSPTIRFGR